MNVESNHTAERESEQTDHGNAVAVQTTLGDEDEDVHKCGRCQAEYSTLDAFIQHKLLQNCKRPLELQEQVVVSRDATQEVSAPSETHTEVTKLVEEASSDEPEKTETTGEPDVLLGRGQRRRTASAKACERVIHSSKPQLSDTSDNSKQAYAVNEAGRYVCYMCDKTFKTTNILRTHLNTHSEQKNFACELCGSAFRTKGSLIRHYRRHTDERPYRCVLCGLSFRESGALTRHLKSITPCTEKIRFHQFSEILVGKDGIQKETMVVLEPRPPLDDSEVVQQVHFTVEEQQVVVEQVPAETLVATEAVGDSLICQAIINSGIGLETETTMPAETTTTMAVAAVVEEVGQEELEEEEVEEEEVEEEEVDEEGEHQQSPETIEKVLFQDPDSEQIHVTEECVEMELEMEEVEDMSEGEEFQKLAKLHKCPHCNRSFKGLNYLRFHIKGHSGYKPFRCTLCQKEFLTGYLLKKHMDVHVSERRYKCGECGKLYKTIGHVREHMRAHSDERPYHCTKCNKGYKTKNAVQVHLRTHAEDKPFVCHFCLRGFREKGSLVRHIRHHTGEKPYKCTKCGRGFAEHGTLNRHLRAKGGCQKEDESKEAHDDSGGGDEGDEEQQETADSLATAAIISEDPHTVLVEFSSVVADTQEYIIGTPAGEAVQGEEVTLIQATENQMGNHIMRVVQEIVNQSRGAGGVGGRQIIVRNTELDEEGASISDCGDTITIATPESLTKQVAMTLASAISDGTLLATSGTTVETVGGTVTMVTAATDDEAVATQECMEVMVQHQHGGDFVLSATEEVEIQTVVV